MSKHERRGSDRAEAVSVNPWPAGRAELGLVLDVLEEDDRLPFAPGR